MDADSVSLKFQKWSARLSSLKSQAFPERQIKYRALAINQFSDYDSRWKRRIK
jgi:hypothetical protein